MALQMLPESFSSSFILSFLFGKNPGSATSPISPTMLRTLVVIGAIAVSNSQPVL